MIASDIPKTLTQFVEKDNPYQCILIDGSWGIGKTFQIDQTLQRIPRSATVSLFGAKSIDEMFLQLVVQICDRFQIKGKSFKKVLGPLVNLSKAVGETDYGTLSPFVRFFSYALPPQSLLEKILSLDKSKQPSLIVFDDIERVNENHIDFDVFLGTVETLLHKQDNVKVLFVANLEQLPSEVKNVWDKYSEKIINRVYLVDELSDSIEFFPGQADNDFALFFMRQHGCKNLRTLVKANNFFNDILYCLKKEDTELCRKEGVLKSLRSACYAVVFEDIEKIYEQKYQRLGKEGKSQDTFERVLYKMYNSDKDRRICDNYLAYDTLAKKLVPLLIRYLEKGYFDYEQFVLSIIQFSKDDKPTYYGSDEEVLSRIEILRSDINNHQYTGIPDLVSKADEMFIWCEVMGVNVDDIEKNLCDELSNEYKKFLERKGKLDFSPSSICFETTQSDRMKNLLREFAKRESRIYETFLVGQIQNALRGSNYRKLFGLISDVSAVLRKKQNHNEDDVIKEFTTLFCNERFLPIGSISEIQYFCCQDAYILAMTYFPESYTHFLQEQEEKHKSSKMFSDRMKHIREEYEKVRTKGE